ncbi:MAG: hypothetical protein IIZ40_00645 [Bacilli bacterium]|nr:hypothetical protein [Bacilli bacterium]
MSEEEYFRLKEMQPIIKLEDKDEEIKQLKDQLQQKENIIKEVREKLLRYGETFDLKVHQQMQKELLEILDDEKV